MNRLKELHREKNLSQGLLAEIFGVNPRTLRRWECGECYKLRTKFTRKELEDAGFGWVFKCKGVKVEEVE